MSQYNTPFYPDSSGNYSRIQALSTNHYIYDDPTDNLRITSPLSQDYSQPNSQETINNLRRQLNEQMKRRSFLAQQVSNLQYQNEQMKRNQYMGKAPQNSYYLTVQNERLREQIQKKKQLSNVPQHLIDQLSELRRQNNWLRQNASNLNRKNLQKY